MLLMTAILMIIIKGTHARHLKPLGLQRKPEGHVDVLTEIPDVKTFFYNYLKGSKPAIFKGASKLMPAFSKWTDDYLKKEFGHLTVEVEEGKKENRSRDMWRWPFEKFLDRYQNDDIYMVDSLGEEMRRDLHLIPCLSCGGFSKVFTDVVMWFSSGGTKSVLHNDFFDNINCLFSGSKKLFMVDWKYRKYIKFDNPNSASSNVDVDAVDLDKYPGLAKAPWWEGSMEAGDCLFIPYRWFHQVTSFTGSDNRNLAVNIWFYHMKNINFSDCESNNENSFVSLDNIKLRNKESVRYLLSLELGSNDYIDIGKLTDSLYISEMNIGKSEVTDMLYFIDSNKDKKVSLQEIRNLKDSDLLLLSDLFPGLLEDDGDTEGEEEVDNKIDEPPIKKKVKKGKEDKTSNKVEL